jgi:hypothetical protein
MKIQIKPTLKQHLAWQAVEDPIIKYPVFGGGAGGGKSWWGCEFQVVRRLMYPGTKGFIGREELKRLMGSTFLTFVKVLKFHNIDSHFWKLNGQYNYIEFKNGSRIDLLDLKYLPSDPLYERYGSLEYTDGFIEEAGEVHFGAFDVLKSRVGRCMNLEYNLRPKIVLTCNPSKNWLYHTVYMPWEEGALSPDFAFIQSLYRDNPHTAASYEEQLASITTPAIRERLRAGNWRYADDPTVLIPYAVVTDMFTNTAEYSEHLFATVDVARFGGDQTIIRLWRGWHNYKTIVRTKLSVTEVIELVKQTIVDERIPRSHVVIDEDGIGGGVVDGIGGVRGFMANRTALVDRRTGKPENYASLKDQCGYKLAEIANANKIQVTCTDPAQKDLIIQEMGELKTFQIDKDKPLRLLPKEKIKENIGRSPDHLDTFIMRAIFEYQPPVNPEFIVLG